MTKLARQITKADSGAICRLHEDVEAKPLGDQLAQLKNEFRSVTRGLEYRLRLVEAENRELRNTVSALVDGVRTRNNRREAMFEHVAGCGRADDAG